MLHRSTQTEAGMQTTVNSLKSQQNKNQTVQFAVLPESTALANIPEKYMQKQARQGTKKLVKMVL